MDVAEVMSMYRQTLERLKKETAMRIEQEEQLREVSSQPLHLSRFTEPASVSLLGPTQLPELLARLPPRPGSVSPPPRIG